MNVKEKEDKPRGQFLRCLSHCEMQWKWKACCLGEQKKKKKRSKVVKKPKTKKKGKKEEL